MEKIKNKIISECCRAKIRYSDPAPDFIGDKKPLIGTCYIICTKCNKPCNLYIPIRRTWKINPSTKIKGDEREKNHKKEIDKEIKEIGNA
jgi:hypothetical protein